MTVATNFRVAYEGPAPDARFLGYTQANFVLRGVNRRSREVAIMVNDPAIGTLAEAAGFEITTENRDRAARALGAALLAQYASGEGRVEPTLMVSRALLSRHPELVEAVRAEFAGAPSS